MNKTEKIKEIQKILNKSTQLPRLLEPTEFDYIFSVLKTHPNFEHKNKCGIKNIWIKKTMFGKNTFFVERIDGSTTDFSYLKCLNGDNHKQNVFCALRTAIRPQIVEFRNNYFNGINTSICPLTGEKITTSFCHVDHEKPTFKKLATAFIEENNLVFDEIKVGGINQDNSIKLYLVDSKLSEKWEKYHKDNAKLRVVSIKGNLSRKRYNDS